MKYAIVSKGDPFSLEIVDELHRRLKEINLICDTTSPDLVVTVGGDGTVLKAVHNYISQIEKVVFVGIHTGKLGFYTDYIPNNLDVFIDNIKKNNNNDVTFPLLNASVCTKDECIEMYALNEIALLNAFHTQHIDVYINEHYFESFQGTGLCISTPSGSSAYNKSLGGALIHPKIKAFQMTEMGSINNNVYRTISSPMIFPQSDCIFLKSPNFNEELTISIDHMHRNLKDLLYIKIKLSERVVTFRQYNDNDFWKRVHKSFL